MRIVKLIVRVIIIAGVILLLTNSPRQKPADSAIINQCSKIEVLQGLQQWSLPQPYFLYSNKST